MRNFVAGITLLVLGALPLRAQEVISYGAPCTSSQVASCQLKKAPGVLYEFQVNNWSTSVPVTVMLLDANTVPGSGVTVAPVKTWSLPVAPSSNIASGISVSWIPDRLNLPQSGVLLLCSSTGPTTYTPATTCTMSGGTQ